MSSTENRHPDSQGMDALDTPGILRLMLREQHKVLAALEAALPEIERAVEDAVAMLEQGGTVVYAGAGTSGRLGVLDASEIYPTFGAHGFRAIMAGGDEALRNAIEGAEDDRDAGAQEGKVLGKNDLALGISASGTTPFVLGFLEAAHERGTKAWLMTSNDITPPPFIDGTIKILTGPELVAGSTRLNAGTATKIALNMFSTAVMVHMGGVHNGLMVDVVPSNRKLIARAEGIIREITGCSDAEATDYLKRSGMKPKVASLMLLRAVEREEAEAVLEASGGSLRRALENKPTV